MSPSGYDRPGHKWWMKWRAPTGRWWRQWRQPSAAALVSAKRNKRISDTCTANQNKAVIKPLVGLTVFGNKTAACGSIRKQTLRKERSDSHIFMFCTFFSLKWGISDFLALRAEVRWLKNLANSNLWWRENMDTHGQRWKHIQKNLS